MSEDNIIPDMIGYVFPSSLKHIYTDIWASCVSSVYNIVCVCVWVGICVCEFCIIIVHNAPLHTIL